MTLGLGVNILVYTGQRGAFLELLSSGVFADDEMDEDVKYAE